MSKMYIEIIFVIIILMFEINFADKGSTKTPISAAKRSAKTPMTEITAARLAIQEIRNSLIPDWPIRTVENLMKELNELPSENRYVFLCKLKSPIIDEIAARTILDANNPKRYSKDVQMRYREMMTAIEYWNISDHCIQQIAEYVKKNQSNPNCQDHLKNIKALLMDELGRVEERFSPSKL